METWEHLERTVAEIVGGRVTPGSGRLRVKGDVRTDKIYVECKQRTRNTPGRGSLPGDWFRTAEANTKGSLVVPLLAVREERGGVPSPIQFFCTTEDCELFTTMTTKDYTYPKDWVPVTTESVKEYARES